MWKDISTGADIHAGDLFTYSHMMYIKLIDEYALTDVFFTFMADQI